MANIIPTVKPKLSRQELIDRIKHKYPEWKIPPILFAGIRGYYKNTMGKEGINDRALYDDAIFILAKDEFIPYNGNTDPGAFRTGIANLKPGIWEVYKFDLHNGKYLAICQRGGKVTVIRDKKGEDTGMFGINIHRGGFSVTSSLGCQTIPPPQWEDFITNAQKYAARYIGNGWRAKSNYPYVLLEQ